MDTRLWRWRIWSTKWGLILLSIWRFSQVFLTLHPPFTGHLPTTSFNQIKPLLSQLLSAPLTTAYSLLLEASFHTIDAVVVKVWPRVVPNLLNYRGSRFWLVQDSMWRTNGGRRVCDSFHHVKMLTGFFGSRAIFWGGSRRPRSQSLKAPKVRLGWNIIVNDVSLYLSCPMPVLLCCPKEWQWLMYPKAKKVKQEPTTGEYIINTIVNTLRSTSKSGLIHVPKVSEIQ